MKNVTEPEPDLPDESLANMQMMERIELLGQKVGSLEEELAAKNLALASLSDKLAAKEQDRIYAEARAECAEKLVWVTLAVKYQKG